MLPAPAPELASHSALLVEQIRLEIDRCGGWIGFERYMEMALYAPGLGYYSGGLEKFGPRGDFVTAPMLGPAFAACIGRQCAEVIDALGGGSVLEFGAGNGQLAAEVLLAMKQQGCEPDRYLIVETSAELGARQKDTLEQSAGTLADCVEWLDSLPERGVRGVVLANEVLDAMPVLRFVIDGQGQAVELGVTSNGTNFELVPASQPLPPDLQNRLQPYRLPPGYSSEIGRQAEAWTRSVADHLEAGIMLLIDYGFPQREYYHRDRKQGTLMCHYRHHAHDDSFLYPGLQDMTAHVDFSGVWHVAREAGLELAGYCSQGAFLLSLGVLDELQAVQQSGDTAAALAVSQQIKKLTLPHEMGELFKVIGLGREFESPLSGFAMADHRHKLS
jgi:SAM-dependent MidA family methyltransferase